MRQCQLYVILVISCLCSFASFSLADDGVIRIGVSAPLTGPVARFGEWSVRGVQLAVDEINSLGGIEGKKVEVVLEDDKCSPKEAVSIVRKFQDVKKINKLIVVCTAPGPAIAPLTRGKSLVFSPSFKVKALEGPLNSHYFSLQPSMKRELQALMKYAHQKGFRSISIVSTLNDFWESYRQNLEEIAQDFGLKVVSVEESEMANNDFRTLITRMKSIQPDVVFAGLNPEPLANFMRQKSELDFETQTLGVWFSQSPDLIRIAGDRAEGLVYSYHYKDGMTDRNLHFAKMYNARFREQSEFASASSYDAVYLLKKLIEQCDTDDATCLIRNVSKIKDFEGASGMLSFANGSAEKEVFLKTVQNKTFQEYVG